MTGQLVIYALVLMAALTWLPGALRADCERAALRRYVRHTLDRYTRTLDRFADAMRTVAPAAARAHASMAAAIRSASWEDES